MLLIKNPVGFNEILRTFVTVGDARHVLIAINDNHPDGRDVSWLWDVDFEMLADARAEGRTNGMQPLLVSGIRAEDMAVRLKYAGLPVGSVIPDPEEAIKTALDTIPPHETLYVLPTYTAPSGKIEASQHAALRAACQHFSFSLCAKEAD